MFPAQNAGTLVDLLRTRALDAGDRGYRFLSARGEETRLSFADLDRRARAVAVALDERGLRGQCVLLCYPPGLEFLAGFFGCVYAGAVAVPAYPPRPRKADARLLNIVENCRPRLVLSTVDLAAAQLPQLRRVPCLDTAQVADDLAARWHDPGCHPSDLAVLQYTSGSTGDPKGVMLDHACLMHNLACITQAMRLETGHVGVCWLPAFHDMGLVGNLLGTLHFRGDLILLSPLTFLQDPFRWLQAVSRWRAHISGGPCFAYDLCVKRITAEQRRQLDLSAWSVAYLGAEPILPRVLDNFVQTFAGCGFRPQALFPCFGLAESTLMVTGAEPGRSAVVRAFLPAALEKGRAEPEPQGRPLVSCGRPVRETDLAVVHPQTGQPLPADSVGEVWVSGPSVARGYFEHEEATRSTFQATLPDRPGRTYLRTGDLGFFHDGELYIAGRLKDLLIIRGRNCHPQDIEVAIQSACPELRGAAAFTCERQDGAALVVVAEVGRGHQSGQGDELFARLREAVAEEFGLELSGLALIRPGTLPRTSSGKIARREACRRFEAGQLDAVEQFTAPAPVPSPATEHSVSRPGGERRWEIHDWLIDRLARQLGLPPQQIDPDRPFAAFGLDSLTLVAIAGDLERWLGRPLTPTLLYSAPTVASLANLLAGLEPQPAGPAEQPADHRIAVLGIGCRFPGADGPEAFWELLSAGRCAIRDLPERRWQEPARSVTTTRGGYLDDVRHFDAAFFGISPREAVWIDPQHRLLLEVAYQALEHAGLAVDRLAGSRAGVFVGISTSEYANLLLGHAGYADAYLGTGNAPSMAAHRLSYHLDLRGPSLAIDTACSSSLTALHYACRSLRSGECELAVAGGVSLILSPTVTEALSRASMLSPQARCKTFDASADGYVRGEGCGVVVLKPLAAALRDGDPVLAVIEATAVNQDGRSNGITAPNGAAQVDLIRRALRQAGVSPADVSCVEAHGTGTSLGDPIEFDALRAALGEAPTPCALSSAKTNLGHLEAAAGIAGFIKVVLQLGHRQLVPHLHLEHINPLVGLAGTRFFIPRSLQDWPGTDRPRLAGVSAFGFGGSNAHVLLAEAPAPLPADRQRPPHLLPLSAHCEPALRELASLMAARLRRADADTLADICFTAGVGRSHHPHRLAVTGSDPGALAGALEQWLNTGRAPHVAAGKASRTLAGRVAFLFTGQGAVRANAGRALYEGSPAFRSILDRCDELVRRLAGFSVLEALADPARLESTAVEQPVLFSFSCALAGAWRTWGIEPSLVMGHSAGELAAACVAGMFSLEEGLRLAVERGRLMQACPEGAMLACLPLAPLIPTQLTARLRHHADGVSLAACNGPHQTVLSGPVEALARVALELGEQGIASKRLRVGRAFHSALIEPALPGLREMAATVRHQEARIPLISNLTGEVVRGPLDAEHWVRHARQPVQFAAGIQTLHQAGITHFVEIGPAAVLTRLGASCLPAGDAVWLASLGGEPDSTELLATLGRLYADGGRIHWDGWFARTGRPAKCALPTYPFQRRSFWVDDIPRAAVPASSAAPSESGSGALRWRPRSHWKQHLPRRAAPFDQVPGGLAGVAAEARASQEPAALDAAERLRPSLDRLAGLYVATALRQLGWRTLRGEWQASALAVQLGVQPGQQRLLLRLLGMAAEDGWLDFDGRQVVVHTPPPLDDPDELHSSLRQQFPAFDNDLLLVHHCARHLASVLQGKTDPLQVLFGADSLRLTEQMYAASPVARFFNDLLARSVERLLAALPADGPVRILELGAGTGGSTQALLPLLPPDRVEYVFTDVSSAFLTRARARFAAFPFVDYRTLDIEAAPSPQGFADGQVDLVIAANVLHSTGDLRRSVRNARRLLVPGGVLALLEGTGPRRLLDLVFGPTEGWWKFHDSDLRPDYPLLAPAGWLRLLEEEGFAEVVAVPAAEAGTSDQVVLLARLPVQPAVEGGQNGTGPTAQTLWLLSGEPSPLLTALDARLRHAGDQVVSVRPGQEPPAPAGSLPMQAVFLGGPVRFPSSLPLDKVWRVSVGEAPLGPSAGPLAEPWGLLRPGQTEGLIDLDPAQPVALQAATLAEALRQPGRERAVAYRGDQRYVPELPQRAEPTEPAAAPVVAAPDRKVLLAASPFERRALVEGYLRQEFASLLGTQLSDEDLDTPIQSLGLDSLMGIQMRNRVETALGVSVSLVAFLKGLPVSKLVDSITEQLTAELAGPAATCRQQAPVVVAAEGVQSLSENEVDSLLRSLLEQPPVGR